MYFALISKKYNIRPTMQWGERFFIYFTLDSAKFLHT